MWDFGHWHMDVIKYHSLYVETILLLLSLASWMTFPPPSLHPPPPSLPLSHFRANCDRILWYAHLTFNPYSTDILFSLTHDVSFSEYDVSSSVSARSLKLSNTGPVPYWMGDRLRLPGGVCTRTCVQRCRVEGLREPRKSDVSSVWTRVGRKRTSMDVGAVSIRRDPRKSTMRRDITIVRTVTLHTDPDTDVGFYVHCETYGEISPSPTLSYTLHCSVWFCRFK